MRKFKRMLQKATIALAVGTASLTASIVPVSSAISVQAADYKSEYEAKAKELEAWAEEKGFDIELVDLGEFEVNTQEDLDEQLQNFLDAYDIEMEETVESPVYLYLLELSYNPTESNVTRTISFVDKDGNKLKEDVIQTGGTGSQIYHIDGTSLNIEGDTTPWEAVSPETIEGYTIESTDNIDKKDNPTTNEIGKVVYVKDKEPTTESETTTSTETDNPSEDFAINEEDDYEVALLKMKAYAESKGKEPTTETSDSIEVSTDEKGDPDEDSIKNYEKELVKKMKEVIDKGEDPKIVTGHVSWYHEKAYYRIFEVVDEDGNTISDEGIQDSLVQSAIISKTGGSEDFDVEGSSAKSYQDFNEEPEWEEMTPPELEGYEFVSGENTEAKEATKDETGKLIYKKKSNNSKTDTVKTIKRTTRFIFEGDSNHPTIDDIVDTVDYEKISADQTASIGLKPSEIHFDAVDIPEVEGWKIKSTKNTDEINGVDSYDDIEAEVVFVKDEKRDDSDIDNMSLSDIIKEIKNSDIKLNETKKDTETAPISERKEKENELKTEYGNILKKIRDAVDNGDESFDIDWRRIEFTEAIQAQNVTRTITFEFQNGDNSRSPITQTSTFTFKTPTQIIDTETGLIGELDGENRLVVYPAISAPEIDGWELISKNNTDEIRISYNESDNPNSVISKVNTEGKFVYKKKAEPVTPTEPTTEPIEPTTEPTPSTEPIDIPTEPEAPTLILITPDNLGYGVSLSDLRQTFERNINFVFDNGTIAASPITQTVTLERTAQYNTETGEIIFSEWNTGTFGEVTVPEIAGYTPDVYYIASTPVTIDSEIVDEFVTYYITDVNADDFGDVITEAIVDESTTTPVIYLEGTPDTGDTVNTIPMAITAASSIVGIMGTGIIRKKRKK